MEKHLPTTHLAPQSRALFAKELVKGCSLAETKSLANLPIAAQRTALLEKIAALGRPLQRSECDGCLHDLALVVPRAGLDEDGVDRMCDLYFGLLREKGVTRDMMVRAGKTFVMAPKKGKPRFFPDPGELYEICADEAAARSKTLKALQSALAVLDGGAAALLEESDPQVSPEMVAKLHDLAASMSVKPGAVFSAADDGRPAIRNTGRPCTDAPELIAALEKRTGKPIAQLRKENAA